MKRWILVAAWGLAAQLGATETDERAARVRAALPELDKMYAQLAEKEHIPGLVYGVVLDGKLIHWGGTGFANQEDKVAATRHSLFRVASMTKNFVAMAALKLRDEGKLRLDDPVVKYLPELRHAKLPTSDSTPVTVGMLLTMTTGLPEDNPWGDRQMARSNAEIEKLLGKGLSFASAPGTSFEYSNLGYIMLGKVVSKASGMRYQDYITRKILLPLGMTSTTWEYSKIPADKLALGYHWLNNAWVREPILPDGDGAAMGGLISSIDDYGRFVAFHLSAWPARDGAETGPLKRASVRELHMPRAFAGLNQVEPVAGQQGARPMTSFYAYGLTWRRDARGNTLVGHSGGLPGYGSQYWFAPEQGVGIMAFGNLRYAPVYRPTETALRTLIERAGLYKAPPAATPVLLARQQQVAQLVQGWDEQLGNDIAAENFFLDRSRAEWIKHAAAQLDKIGKVVSVGPIKPENALRGSFPLVGERGTLNVWFSLSPESDPKVQALELRLQN